MCTVSSIVGGGLRNVHILSAESIHFIRANLTSPFFSQIWATSDEEGLIISTDKGHTSHVPWKVTILEHEYYSCSSSVHTINNSHSRYLFQCIISFVFYETIETIGHFY